LLIFARNDGAGRRLTRSPSELDQAGIGVQVVAIFALLLTPSTVSACRCRDRLALVTALPPFLIGAAFAWIVRSAFL
jgi:hypothetical protein